MEGEHNMEKRLKTLIEANSETTRANHALEWKRRGKKVVGVVCSYIPDELIYAADLLPYRITGTWRHQTTEADVYRPLSTDLYYTHALESLLEGELDFLDGIIFTNRDDDMRRFYDVVNYVMSRVHTHIIYVPHHDRDVARQAFDRSLQGLAGFLEQLGGTKITDDRLLASIGAYNIMRDLLYKVYELRKKLNPPLSGSEILGITTAARIMPVDLFNQELAVLLPYLEQRETSLAKVSPRLLVSSDVLDHRGYLDVIEKDAGTLVAMDDLDTGARWFWRKVSTNSQHPIKALAHRYLSRPGCPRMYDWDNQVDQVVQWAREFHIDGIIDLTLRYCYPREFRRPFFNAKLGEANLPCLSIEREYELANIGQLTTRVQAFAEMISDR